LSSSLVYFTDRWPKDPDPYSFWFWKELQNRAESGFEVFVYLMDHSEKVWPTDLHSSIQLRSALQKPTPMSFSPFIKSLISTQAESICLVEPQKTSLSLWPLFFLPQLKQMGMIDSKMSYLCFQSEIRKSMIIQNWIQVCDVVQSTQTLQPLRPIGSSAPSIRFEELRMDPRIFKSQEHWSTQDLEHKHILPGALSDLVSPKSFLRFATNELAKDPETQFVFLNGLGSASKELKKMFLKSSLASSFFFPEGLTGAQIGHALFHSKRLLVDHIRPDAIQAGLARKIVLERQRKSLTERPVYGLL